MVARKKLTVLKAQLEVGLAGAVGDFAISRDYDRFADGSKARGIGFRVRRDAVMLLGTLEDFWRPTIVWQGLTRVSWVLRLRPAAFYRRSRCLDRWRASDSPF